MKTPISRPAILLLAALAAVAGVAPSAFAVSVDGTLDPIYGPPEIVQTLQTGLSAGQIVGDSNRGELAFANGSELDAAYGWVDGDTLRLFLGGNLALVLNQNQNGTIRHVLDVFIDHRLGGQNVLSGLGAGVVVNGLTFDAGFAADAWFELEGDDNGFSGPREWTVRMATITAMGGTVTTLGSAPAGGSGPPVSGMNPHGVKVALDNRNTAGVTFGCGAASGAGVTTGIEWAIPIAAIGEPQSCFWITAFIRTASNLTNQVLAPLPEGTCPPGPVSSVNFASFAGDQAFSVCEDATDAPAAFTGGLALASANPARGTLRVSCTLAGDESARLDLIDVTGRVRASRTIGGDAGRTVVVDLGATARVAPGVYRLRLVQGRAVVTRAVAIVR